MNDHEIKDAANRAKYLLDLEEKILRLDDSEDIDLYIKLYSEFYQGIFELRSKFIGVSSLNVPGSKNLDHPIQDLQTILNVEHFQKLNEKRNRIVIQAYLANTNLSPKDSTLDEIAEDAIENTPEETKEKINLMNSIERPDIDEEEKLADSHLFDWFGPYEYVEALSSAGAILVKSESLPDNFENVTSTVKKCYAFQQYLAVTVLCRTALEIALRDLYMKLGFKKKGSPEYGIAKQYFDDIREKTGKTYINEFKPSPVNLRYLICKLPEYEGFYDDLDKLYSDLSRIIHGSRVINKDRAESYMRKTYWIIHEMYLELKADERY
jgi:hypothetical protein